MLTNFGFYLCIRKVVIRVLKIVGFVMVVVVRLTIVWVVILILFKSVCV